MIVWRRRLLGLEQRLKSNDMRLRQAIGRLGDSEVSIVRVRAQACQKFGLSQMADNECLLLDGSRSRASNWCCWSGGLCSVLGFEPFVPPVRGGGGLASDPGAGFVEAAPRQRDCAFLGWGGKTSRSGGLHRQLDVNSRHSIDTFHRISP